MGKMILGELEQKIMCVMWSTCSPLKPSEVLEKIGEKYAYTTIMTSLSRLHSKGLLLREKIGRAYIYKCAKSREAFLKSHLSNLFNNLFQNYGDLVIYQFVDSLSHNPQDVQKLKKIVNGGD